MSYFKNENKVIYGAKRKTGPWIRIMDAYLWNSLSQWKVKEGETIKTPGIRTNRQKGITHGRD